MSFCQCVQCEHDRMSVRISVNVYSVNIRISGYTEYDVRIVHLSGWGE